MNNYGDNNLRIQRRDRARVLNTPSLIVVGNEAVAEEIIRDLLFQDWIETTSTPRPQIVIPNDIERSQKTTVARTQAATITVISGGETEQVAGSTEEMVDTEVTITITINVPKRGGRQLMHNLKAECRDIIHMNAKTLSPYHRMYYDGFKPSYESVNVHSGEIQMRLIQYRVPIIGRRTRGQETPSDSPELFPQGLQV